jgi:hypothetical protein
MGHLTKWLFFNLLFGAIPYGLTVALNQLQSPDAALLHPSSEVLFIAVVATSSALGELWDGDDDWTPKHARRWRARWQLLMLAGVLFSSILYGAYVYHTFLSPGRGAGVDCAVVGGLAAEAQDAAAWISKGTADWRQLCQPWARVQARFFQLSLWFTAFWVALSTLLLYHYPPKRG